MNDYLLNLWAAILGRNPYQKEINAMKAELAKAIKDVQLLKEQSSLALSAWEQSEQMVADYERQVNELAASRM